jgi:hypothetical protein
MAFAFTLVTGPSQSCHKHFIKSVEVQKLCEQLRELLRPWFLLPPRPAL